MLEFGVNLYTMIFATLKRFQSVAFFHVHIDIYTVDIPFTTICFICLHIFVKNGILKPYFGV